MATQVYFERYGLLMQADRRLAQADSVEAVLEVLRTQARAIADADGVAVIRREGDEVVYIGEDAIAPLWTGQRFPIERCISGLAMLECAPILIPDIANDARVPLSAYLSTFVQSMAAFPIGLPAPTAALGVYWREARRIDRDVESLVSLLTQAANAAFQRLALQEERRRLAA